MIVKKHTKNICCLPGSKRDGNNCVVTLPNNESKNIYMIEMKKEVLKVKLGTILIRMCV